MERFYVLPRNRYSPFIIALDNVDRRYVFTVNDAPPEIDPCEKLHRYGPKVLSTPELFAVLLSGDKSELAATRSASKLIREYGEESFMAISDPEKLSKDLRISLPKALQVVACAELGRRFYTKNAASAPVIRTARDVFLHVRETRELSREHLRGLYLNAQYKVIHDEVISIGTVDTNIIHPREVFRPALEYAAVAVVLVHNHPSGSTEPSEADLAITRQLVEAGALLGVSLIDHIIVTKDSFASIPAEYSHT